MKKYLFIIFSLVSLVVFSQSSKKDVILKSGGLLVVFDNKIIETSIVRDFWTVNSGSPFTYSMILKGTSQDTLDIFWGDGLDTTIIFTAGNQIITHDYAAGEYTQKWDVDPLSLTGITVSDQNLTGELPDLIQYMYNLTTLSIRLTDLAADFTDWWDNLAQMTGMTTCLLNNNMIYGDVSGMSALSSWSSINLFYWYGNQLSGNAESLSSYSAWTTIDVFFYYGNLNITGDLSVWNFAWPTITQFVIAGQSVTGCSYIPTTAIANYNASINAIGLTSIDNLFADYDTYFASNTPIKNLVINVSGGTNASPTDGASNTNIQNLITTFTNAGFTFTATINP